MRTTASTAIPAPTRTAATQPTMTATSSDCAAPPNAEELSAVGGLTELGAAGSEVGDACEDAVMSGVSEGCVSLVSLGAELGAELCDVVVVVDVDVDVVPAVVVLFGGSVVE